MAAPQRGNTGSGTYFVTACAFQKQQVLQSERMAELFLDVLLHYRSQEKYLLHEICAHARSFSSSDFAASDS
jgi:hypothetical protein